MARRSSLLPLLFSACAWNVVSGEVPSRPNVVLLVADDQGWADVGYHNPEIRTPHIDALVRDGVELDCHYVMPQCTPTRVALLTGRYPSRFGPHCTQASNEQAFPPDTPTLVRMLRDLGYHTAITGKWHLGSRPEWGPNHYGFQHSHGSLAGAVGAFDHRYRLDSPFVDTWHRDHVPLEQSGHVTDLCLAEAVRWIESLPEPFFLYVPFHAVHTPLVEDEKWLEMNFHIEDRERRLFAAAVSHLDAAVGGVADAIARRGVRQRTLLIYTSDNGAQVDHAGDVYPPPDPALTDFSSNRPLRGRKTEAYEGGIRVPAFVCWPGTLAPRKCSEPIHVVDWFPTLAALLGCEIPRFQSDGRDIWPQLEGSGTEAVVRTFYWVWGKDRTWEALRRGPWKIVRRKLSPGGWGPWELFDLLEDPGESVELGTVRPEKVQELHSIYLRERKKDELSEARSTPAQPSK